ncbi:outer membrane protein assembly factor BamD [Candidatus Pantoea edessiphila]|uniref:Outer membrane protein assembly factor BamD n=1 Tax=Candidatus Pantoea edessiphila TaxID=2044610 RepID=A0A2P5SVL6_9GAMM|nr:outer membrane protein assembly factor BamD [Candidatus Pantoea edessiphila]PPI86371.1 outer membrane protein assembly factor BamD [Candidatus Pantoea edessiphila]
MKIIKYTLTIFTLILMMTGCSEFNRTESSYYSLSKIYDLAQKKMRENNFKSAIKYLKTIENQDFIGLYSQQVRLDLIYAYYKNRDLHSAQLVIHHFINLYPKHPNLDYVIYMKGVIEMSIDNPSLIMKVLNFDYYDRDLEHSNNAFVDFKHILHHYPKSVYANDSYNRLIYLQNRLAKHELSIASFYNERKAYVAVINRIKKMIKYYPDTKATHDALLLMEKAYRKLQINEKADKIAKIIAMNT